ncbi:MAG TPA: hypothetical protein VHR66_17600, partial [Gemmataceae bacterium]|nr:hypothetical protein [Gemmataceae bacterium]
MSTSSTGPSRGISPVVFAVVVLGAMAITAIAVVATTYVTRPAVAGSPTAAGNSATGPVDSEPYPQKGNIKLEGEGSGTVYYPVPYASPPNLTVEPKSRYLIARQDEFGFTWLDRAREAEAIDLLASVPEVSKFLPKGAEPPKYDAKQPELTWEAKGVRGAPGAQALKTFEQHGTFQSDFGQQGQVNFPIPYASPPNVELTGYHEKTVITECTATGFKWKNGSKGQWSSEAGAVTWKAKGIRATQVPK